MLLKWVKELKQRVVAIATKVRRYQERVDRFRQNKMFQNNQRDIWSESVDHNRDVKWWKDLQS